MNSIIRYIKYNYDVNTDTSATITITLFVFVTGFIINTIIKNIRNCWERKKTKRIFEIALSSFLKQVDEQSKAFLQASQSFTFENDGNFVPKRIQILPLSAINEIGYKNTYEAYFSNFRINTLFFFCNKKMDLKLKAFNKIWEAIHSIEFWHNKSFENMDFFNNTYNLYNERRKDALEKNRLYVENMLTAIKQNLQNIPQEISEYAKKVDDITADWQNSTNPTNELIVHEKLIMPLRNLNRNNQNLYLANQMNSILLKATEEFQNQKKLLHTFQEQFKSSSDLFNSYQKSTLKSLEILKNFSLLLFIQKIIGKLHL